VLAMMPGGSAWDLETLRNLERSARAEVKLRFKAIEHHKNQLAAARAGMYLMTPEQHRRRAQVLRKANPQSRAAYLHDLTARLQESDRR
jgi:hypothetical protein